MKFSFDSVAHLYKGLYYNLPQPMKSLLGTIYGSIPIEKRYGPLYTEYLERIRRYESADLSYQEEYLFLQVQKTLRFAQKHIPFHQKRFAEYGVHADDFKTLQDLKKFPTMTKEDIKKELKSLYTEVEEKAVAYYSGGSTSSPTKFYHPLYTSRAKHKAYSVYTLSQIGYKLRDRTLLLKGREVVDIKRDIYWDYEPVDNVLNVTSSYILTDKFPKIYAAAKKFAPKFIFGYPSAVMDFMFASQSAEYSPLKIDGIILASESVTQEQISMLKAYYGDVPVFVDYGHTERVVGAYKIDNDAYRFVGAYGVARNVAGEIVGTSLDNFVMPFINYKTGDEVSGEITYLPDTDIMLRAAMIKGRTQDYLVTYDYRLIPLTTLYVGHHLPAEVVMNLQYRQEEAGRVRVILERGRTTISVEQILKGLKSMVPEGIFFEIIITDRIEKTARGKRVVCVQDLDIGAIKAMHGQEILPKTKRSEKRPDDTNRIVSEL